MQTAEYLPEVMLVENWSRPATTGRRPRRAQRAWIGAILIGLLILLTMVLALANTAHADALPPDCPRPTATPTATPPPPSAVTLSAFGASSAGNRGGCAEGNKMRGLACVVTAFEPGYVSGTCDGGFWFSKVRTARTFRLDATVTVQGCIMADDRLTSAPGWPLRISR